jgi:hypothetical protein
MPTRTPTCTERRRDRAESCGGEIRPSYIAPAPIVGALAAKGDMTYPAACQRCGKTYVDIVSIPMTGADLDLVRDRLSESARQELMATATELTPGCYEVAIAEDRARDFASKAANLGLLVIADKIRQEVNGLTAQRRQRQPEMIAE